MKVIFEVIKGVEGHSLYVGDKHGGHRLAGNKPWGGGEVVHSFKVNVDELRQELDHLENEWKLEHAKDQHAS